MFRVPLFAKRRRAIAATIAMLAATVSSAPAVNRTPQMYLVAPATESDRCGFGGAHRHETVTWRTYTARGVAMDDDSMMSIIDELERYFAGDDELPDEEIIDTDELIHRQENEDAPPAIPPEPGRLPEGVRGGLPACRSCPPVD